VPRVDPETELPLYQAEDFYARTLPALGGAATGGRMMGKAYWDVLRPRWGQTQGLLNKLKAVTVGLPKKTHLGILGRGFKGSVLGALTGLGTGLAVDAMRRQARESYAAKAQGEGMKTAKEIAAAVLSTEARDDLSKKQFALPKQKKYPIPDKTHGENALSRVSQFGTPAQRETVRSKVYSKFPGLKERFKKREGESPTSKENIRKEKLGAERIAFRVLAKTAALQSGAESGTSGGLGMNDPTGATLLSAATAKAQNQQNMPPKTAPTKQMAQNTGGPKKASVLRFFNREC